jgi:hypothetical protein
MICIDRRLVSALTLLISEGLPSDPSSLDLEDVRWGGEDAPAVSNIEVEDAGGLLLKGHPPSPNAAKLDPAAWSLESFTAKVPSRGDLKIPRGASWIMSVAWRDSGRTITAHLKGSDWTVGEPEAGVLWAAWLRCPRPVAPLLLWGRHGNMRLAAQDHGFHGWRFGTCYGEVFLVPNGERWIVAFAFQDGKPPTRQAIKNVLSILGFAFGEELSAGLFRPVTETGIGSALVHVEIHRFAQRADSQLPALPVHSEATWVTRFVERALKFIADQPDGPLILAVNHYFSGLSPFVDSAFLHSWLGAEALAKWGLRTRRLTDVPARVADHDRWIAWVRSHEAEIRALALPGKEQSLIDRVRSSEEGAPSPVQRALLGQGIPWTSQMEDAEKVRNGVAHEGMMPGERPRDWERDLSRVGLARTLITALIGRLTGYDGPITDRSERGVSFAEVGTPDWWPANNLDEDVEVHG